MAETPTRDRVRRHREQLRRQGLRPLQIWVPDVKAPHFADEARRQSLAVSRSNQAEDDQSFADSLADWED